MTQPSGIARRFLPDRNRLVATSIRTEFAMYKHLEATELRETAFAAREKAAQARRLAARAPKAAAVFQQHAGEFEARARELDQRRERIESQIRDESSR